MSKDEAEGQPDAGLAADWSSEQLLMLIDRIEKKASATRIHRLLSGRCTLTARKMDWEAVKFEHFSADDCRQQWEHLVQKVGKIRTLKELLDSAAAWVKKPVQRRGHADLPKKPLSAYFVFQMKMAKKVKKKHPEAGVAEIARIVKKLYDELPESKKARQKERYQQERAEYEERLKEFFDAHPDLKPVAKPRRPANLFVDEQIRKKLEQADDPAQHTDRALHEELRKKYTAKWQSLSDKKKTRWILKSVSQQRDYLAVNPKATTLRLLNANEQRLLAIHQGRPLRPPGDIVRYFMSVCPNAVTVAPDGEATEADQQEQQEPSVRSYASRWKSLPLLEQIEHWRAYYQAVTAYQTEIAEWQAKQDDGTREISVAEESAFAKETASLFNDEEENGKKYGYTIKGPAGLVAFEERRQDHLKAKYPEAATDPSHLREVALAAFLNLSDDKRKTYEDKEKERLAGVVTSVVTRRKRQPAATAKEGGATAAKRLKSGKTLEINGVQLPPEPKKPPRSAYATFLAFRSELQAGDGGSCDVDGVSSSEPSSRKNVISSVSRTWKLLDEKEKELWAERWKAEKMHYEARIKAYEKGLTPEQRAAYSEHRRTQADLHRLQLNEARKAREAIRQQYAKRTVVYHPPGTNGGNKGGKLVQTTIDAVLKTGLARATAETGVGGVDAENADTDDEEQRDSVTDVEDGGISGSEKNFAADVPPARSPRKAAASTTSIVAAPAAGAGAAPVPAGSVNYSDDTDEDDDGDDDKPAEQQSPRKTSLQQQRAETLSDGRKADRAKTKAATSTSSSGTISAAERQPTASESLQGASSGGSFGSQKSVKGHTGAAVKPRKAATSGKA